MNTFQSKVFGIQGLAPRAMPKVGFILHHSNFCTLMLNFNQRRLDPEVLNKLCVDIFFNYLFYLLTYM